MELEKYRNIVGNAKIDEIIKIAENIEKTPIVHVNTTKQGGGVAEILNRMNPLLNELGIPSKWEAMEGTMDFFRVTKKIHNMLHGVDLEFTSEDRDIYLDAQEANKNIIEDNEDANFLIHDPQPAGLIKYKQESQKHWIWRCHIDISKPQPAVWNFLSPFVNQYNDSLFHRAEYTQDLSIPQMIIPPSIDPLSDKNREMSESEIDKKLEDLPEPLPEDKTIITQVSRFDRLKDPVGVAKAFKFAKKHVKDIHLVLAGGTASDDPEGEEVYQEVMEIIGDDDDISVMLLPHDSLLINALQRKSDIIMQKSLKEGFGLTISEGLWKEKPVIATNVGGIKSQIIHNQTGVMVHGNGVKGAAMQIERLVKNPDLMMRLGKNGKQHIKENFLITRHLKDYLLLLLYAQQEEDGDRVTKIYPLD